MPIQSPRDQSEFTKPPATEVEFDILPPAQAGKGTTDLSRIIAWILDDLIRVPGTNFRIGLDPVVGLIPGLGDGSTAVASSVIILQGLQAGVPRIVLVRMALNILLNSILGAVPGIGDLFSAWFKSNRRNYDLLQKYAGTARTSTHADWAIVIAMIGSVTVAGIAISLFVTLTIIRLLAWLFGG